MEFMCLDCGGLFHRPAARMQSHGVLTPGREVQYVSPCCGEGFRTAYRCAICGEVLQEDSVCALCAVCARKVGARLRKFLRENCTHEEQQALDILTEGVSFTRLGQEEEEEVG